MKFTFISGGTGTPKLIQGFREVVDDTDIGVICNSGDDYRWNGLYVCPDLDTVMYLFSNQLDLSKFWGIKDETFNSLQSLKPLGAEDTWFNIGDKDLALHIYRTHGLSTSTLTEITEKVTKAWGIKSTILPMSNNAVQTRIHSGDRDYHFQEYFVKLRTQVDVSKVEFRGNKENTTSGVKKLLQETEMIVVGPSNPVTSIGPILAINEIKKLLEKYREKVILVSPLIGGKAFSGPTVNLMKAVGIDPSPIGIAKHYEKIASRIIFDPADIALKNELQDYEIDPMFESIELSNDNQKKKLADTILNLM